MNREQIIQMAREAHGELLASGRGMHVWHEDAYVGDVQAFCERFAALVAAAEREKFCAVLRQLHDSYSLQSSPETIRARGRA